MSKRRISSEVKTEFKKRHMKGRFSDAIIKVEDVEFKVHKIILCKCSPYFRALFSRHSCINKKVYNIPGLSPEMMQLIIEFAYTGSVLVTGENAEELLVAADHLIIMSIVEACCDFLVEQLCKDNCVGIWQFTKFYFCPQLQQKAFQFVLDTFEQVISSEEFQQLSAQELSNILDSDNLNVRKERTAFEAVLRWISYAPERRKEDFVLLFSKVRLAFVSAEYITLNVVTNDLVKGNQECLQMVEKALQIKAWMNTNNPPLSGVRNPVGRPRLPSALLLAIGGWSRSDPTNGIEAYDVRSNSWMNVTNNLERPRAYHGLAFTNGYVYIFGGFERLENFNSVRRFDLGTHTWDEMAPMYYRRCYVSVTVLDGYIYALGGFDGRDRLSSAERYKPETNQWSLIPHMHERRSDASCTTLHNKIYICGGFNGFDCLQSCEYYSPETKEWTTITPMTTQRSGIGVIAYANRIFAVGGFNGTMRLQSAEAYNPSTNTWHPVSSMLTPRSNFGIGILDDLLFVAGGYNGSTTANDVEFYDASTDEWYEAREMEIFRSALKCCTVFGVPNVAEYTLPRDTLPLLQLENGLVVLGDT